MQGTRIAARFHGRARELDALREVLDRVSRDGEGRVALVEGEGGIGKTRLLDEALADAEARGFHVFRGAAEELERDRPFGAVADALGLTPESRDAESAQIGRLLRGDRSDAADAPDAEEAPELRFRVLDAVLALVERLCSGGPVALALEDLHWADTSTLLVAHHLARRLSNLPIALLLACRPSPRSGELERVVEALPPETQRLPLGPLDEDAVAALVAELVEAEPGPELLRGVEQAAGNPLFVTELVPALQEEGLIELRDGRAELDRVGIPPSLRLTIMRHLSHLPRGTVELLGVASVLGSSFSLTDLSVVLGKPAAELLGALRPALDARVIAESEIRLAFRHDLLREAVYLDHPAPVRAALHLQAGRALASAGAPAGQVATQLALGASGGDRDAVEWLCRAAREAAPRDPGSAIDFLERAIELAGEDHPDRDVMVVDLVRSLMWSGRLDDAEARARPLLAREHDPAVAASLRYALARALAYQGRMGDSIEQVQLALDEPGLPNRERARLLADLAHRRLLSGDLRQARESAEHASAAADRASDELGACVALSALSWAAAFEGRPLQAVELGRRALARAGRRITDPVQLVQPRLYLGLALIAADELSEAEEVLQESRQLSEDLGTAWALPLHHAALAIRGLHAGAWDDAIAEAETSLALGEELGTRVWTVAACGALAAIAVHRDDFHTAERMVAVAERELAVPGGVRFGQNRVARVRSLLLEAGGDAAGALSCLAEAWNRNEAAGSAAYRELGPELVRLALHAGDEARAAAVGRAVQRMASRAGIAGSEAAALRCEGLVHGDTDALLRSVELLRDGARPLERALTCLDAGRVLGMGGRCAEGVSLIEEAREQCEGLGAVREVARAEAALRTLGARPARRGRRRRAESGWESLTKSELRIASLVAEGLSNPQIAERLFVSRRTVETHVSHALLKLNLSSRVQLAAQAARRASATAGTEAPTGR